jgi:hypothetical protein
LADNQAASDSPSPRNVAQRLPGRAGRTGEKVIVGEGQQAECLFHPLPQLLWRPVHDARCHALRLRRPEHLLKGGFRLGRRLAKGVTAFTRMISFLQ